MINFPQRNWTDYGGEVIVATHSIQLSYGRVLIHLGKTSLACGLTCSTGTKILHRYVIQID